MLQAELITKLCDIAHRRFTDANTRGLVIGSVVKLVAQTGAAGLIIKSVL